jgi:hypothetical protein
MKYSLINIYGTESGKVWGSWLQDHMGTLKSAKEAARETEIANGGKINIAIVEAVSSPVAALEIYHGLENLR